MARIRRIIIWLLGGVGGLLTLAIAGILALGHFDARYRISDWRVIIHALTGMGAPAVAADAAPSGFVLPEGLMLSVVSANVPNARFLHLTAAGDLLVSQPRQGQVLRLARADSSAGSPGAQGVLLRGLDRPHGLEMNDGWLYVAETGSVGRIRYDVATGAISGEFQRIVQGIPSGENHWTRTVRMGPDGWMYLAIGSSCNVCIEKHDWRAAIIRFRPDGSGVERFAHGLRNSVGLDWAPWDDSLYATDNGRDLLGDDFPPCELNRIEAGGFYGWPHLNGANVRDPDFGAADPALLGRAIAPAHGFAAHNAPLGIRFLRAPANVARYGRAAIVALHGSWNRSAPDGYKLVLLQWDAQGRISQRDFLTGFIDGGRVRGRPVDIAEAPDGTLYVSDDYAGAIYRIARVQAAPAFAGVTPPAGRAAAVAHPAIVPPAPEAHSAAEREAAAVLAGRLMAEHNCALCHVPGSALAAKWQTLRERYTLDQLTAFFLAPTPPMPVFPLSDAERRALAIHLLAPRAQPMLDSGAR